MIAPARQYGPVKTDRNSRGSTLIELVVAVAVTSILMLGMGSAMLVASRALPDTRSAAGRRVSAAAVAEQLVAELQYATSINQKSGSAIDFFVADRSGDDIPERIGYAWSGISGAALTRQYNGGALVSQLDDVREFVLTYNLRSMTASAPAGNESRETNLAGHDATASLCDYPIRETEWYAQRFWPALPGNAICWKVTRVVFRAKQDGPATGIASVQLYTTLSGTLLETKQLLETTLSTSYLDQEVTFSNAGGISPVEGVGIVLKWVANGVACKVRGRSVGVSDGSLWLGRSTDGGATWPALTGQALLFDVYGTVTTSNAPQVPITYYLEGVEIKLRAGNDSQGVVQTGVRLLNRPEVDQ